jgi:hypothetical protein
MMRKIAVSGLPGKTTTLVLRLAVLLGVHHDLDHVRLTAGGLLLPPEKFRARTAALTRAAGWVSDGSYSKLAA